MARCPILAVALVGYFNTVILAAPPNEAKSPGSDAQPSPNQSVSIEDEANKPVGQGDAEPLKKPETESVGALAVKDAAGQANTRPPIFLGRKRPAADAESESASAAQTPWYRTSLGALGLVLALMAVLYFALRRWAPSIKAQDAGLVRVMGRTVVGPRQSLVLFRVGQRVVLVGVSPDRIDRVCEITDADEVAALTARASQGQTRGDFSAWLDREAAEFVDSDKPGSRENAGNESRSGSKSLSDLLAKLRTTKV